jgi:hypothetical protein
MNMLVKISFQVSVFFSRYRRWIVAASAAPA